MSRRERGKRAAIKAARLSQFYAHRVGAALFDGSQLISVGFNQHKSHPKNLCFTRHAEFNSILRKNSHRRYRNLILYVARLTRTDKISLSRPCSECQKAILSAGIKAVYYTGYSGELERLEFDKKLVAA
jgi:deoxycytidylate deaminase